MTPDPNPNRARALQLLVKTGILRSNYEPPLFRLLWRLGVNIPPPHFVNFWGIVLLMGACYGLIWGAVMWVLQWSRAGIPVSRAAFLVACAALFFGLAMASYYAYGRQKYKLPSWQKLGDSAEVD